MMFCFIRGVCLFLLQRLLGLCFSSSHTYLCGDMDVVVVVVVVVVCRRPLPLSALANLSTSILPSRASPASKICISDLC
jgi:hypothetical protein